MDDTKSLLIYCIPIAIGVLLLFLPAIIANIRDCVDRTAILLINLFFGLTIIGWFVALIWAITGQTVAAQRKKYEKYRMQQMQEMTEMQTVAMQNAMMQMQNWNMMNGGMPNGNMMNNGMQNGNMMNNGMPNGNMMNNGNSMDNGMLNDNSK